MVTRIICCNAAMAYNLMTIENMPDGDMCDLGI